jgi:hypothetical protein
MRYKVKWRAGSDGPLAPEVLETLEEAKARVRHLLANHPGALIDVWNEDETWQIVAPAGVEAWSFKNEV